MRLSLLLLALLALGCTAPAPTLPHNARAAAPSDPSVLGDYWLVIDPLTLQTTLDPVARDSAALGEESLIDLAATLKPVCGDCFRLIAISRGLNGLINLDFTLRHPIPPSAPAKQFEAFDVRMILLTPIGDAIFPDSPLGANGVIAADYERVVNADGYTTRHTEKSPFFLRSTIHPFKWFFVNPPDNRMAYGTSDTERLEFFLSGTTPYKFRLILEAAFTEAADKTLPPTDLGGTANPVYFLPETHVDEAYQVDLTYANFPLETGVTKDVDVTVLVRDWQAGHSVDPLYPNLLNPEGLRDTTGGIAGVSIEIPVLNYIDDTPTTVTGTGTTIDPYIATFTIPTSPTTSGTFPLLVIVTDERQPADLTGLTSLDDLRAFRVDTFDILP